MISFWILLCSAAILTIFLIKMVSENENKFLITLCSIILASNLVLLIQSIDNFDEISKQDYEAIAKVKNMYFQDKRKTSKIELELAPYVEQLSINNENVIPVGMTMRLKF